MTRRRRPRAIPTIVVLLLAAQLIPATVDPRESDPAFFFESVVPVTGEIGSLLRRSCYDCHGGPTQLPWYGRVAPASWLVTYDINESMEHLDFSRWGRLDPRRQAELLREVAEEVRERGMPLARYLWLHADARLTEAERERLGRWAEEEAGRIAAAAGLKAPAGEHDPGGAPAPDSHGGEDSHEHRH